MDIRRERETAAGMVSPIPETLLDGLNPREEATTRSSWRNFTRLREQEDKM
eukprot:gene6731-16538_t